MMTKILVRKHDDFYVVINGKSKLTGNPTFDNPIEALDIGLNEAVWLYFNEGGALVRKVSESFIGNKQSVAAHVANLICVSGKSSDISVFYLDDLELDGKKSFFRENGFSFEFQRSNFEPFKEFQVKWSKLSAS